MKTESGHEARVYVYMSKSKKEKLVDLAQKEARSINNLVNKAIDDYFQDRIY